MREIKLYSFSELSHTAQRKAIKENLDEIGANAKNYLLDIYNDHLGILSEAICGNTNDMFKIEVNSGTNSVRVVVPLVAALDVVVEKDTDQFKAWLLELKHKLVAESFFDKDAVCKIIDKHYEKTFPSPSAFLLDLGNDISVRATEFYANMKSNPEFVCFYINGIAPKELYFIAEDDILTDCEFLEDGTLFNAD